MSVYENNDTDGTKAMWECSACTFHNNGLLNRCEICTTPNSTPTPSPRVPTNNPKSSSNDDDEDENISDIDSDLHSNNSKWSSIDDDEQVSDIESALDDDDNDTDGDDHGILPYTVHGAPLPHGWEARLDTSTDTVYYINHTTQETTWEDPRTQQTLPGNVSVANTDSPRAHPSFWLAKHQSQPRSHGTITTRIVVPTHELDVVFAAGGILVYSSLRSLFGAAVADECGFVRDLAVVEVTTRTSTFAGKPIAAASYRWEGAKERMFTSGRKVMLPTNNMWFVNYVHNEPVWGWLDFVASDFGRLIEQVMPQMGAIYRSFVVVPRWLIDPLRTMEAMERGWIFQESAFTTMDAPIIHSYRSKMTELTSYVKGDTPPPDWTPNRAAVADALCGFWVLFERRGEAPLVRTQHYLFEQAIKRFRETGEKDDLKKFNWPRLIKGIKSVPNDFFLGKTYGDLKLSKSCALRTLEAFFTLKFTFEQDCVCGCLSMISQTFFGEVLGPDDHDAARGLIHALVINLVSVSGYQMGLDELPQFARSSQWKTFLDLTLSSTPTL
eukprot:m.51998 g.51998  ORF g.51998 m.51998 type:complete len:553 (+) comp21530_c0_seq1:359-2017(+)